MHFHVHSCNIYLVNSLLIAIPHFELIISQPMFFSIVYIAEYLVFKKSLAINYHLLNFFFSLHILIVISFYFSSK